MKTFALLLALIFGANAARANDSWAWIDQHNGTFLKSNGIANDGWVYTRQLVNCCYQYTQSYQLQVVQPQAKPYAVPALDSPDFETNLVNSLYQLQKQKTRLQALRESGLIDPTQARQYTTGYNNGYQTTSQQILTQGFAQTSNTVYGNAAYSSQQYQIDPNALLHNANATANHLADITERANAFVQANNREAIAGSVEVAKITAAGQALVASIQASQPPRTETNTYQTVPVGGNFTQPQQGQQQAAATGQFQPRDTNLGAVLLQGSCLKCHGATPKDNKLSLLSLRTLTWAEKGKVLDESKRRMSLPLTDDQHMPPKAEMPPEQQPAILSALAQ